MCRHHENETSPELLHENPHGEGSPSHTLPLADFIQAELHTLSLSEKVEEQLRILDGTKGILVDEEVIVSAMDALRTLIVGQGYEPSPSQQDRLRAHGFAPGDGGAIQAKDVRRYARRMR